MHGEFLDRELRGIDPGACRLIRPPSRIWLFGGECDPNKATPSSLRDSFWRATAGLVGTKQYDWLGQIARPEDYPDWWAFSGYSNLLEFERDASYLSRLIILFSESPGSHVELGILASDNLLSKQLLAVVQSKFLTEANRRSFIRLGPLERLEPLQGRCVISAEHNFMLPAEDIEAILESAQQKINEKVGSESLDPTNPMHRILFVADLVDLLIVCKLGELQSTTTHFGFKFSAEELGRITSLLAFFGYIGIQQLGLEKFFVRRLTSEAPWVDYSIPKASGLDAFRRQRFKIGRNDWISKDPKLSGIERRKQ